MINKNFLDLLNKINKEEPKEGTFNKYDRILIIDGLNLFMRNFAVMNAINHQGVHIGGLSGFLRSLGFLINQINPTSAYVIFDGVGSSINRKNLVPEYKSNRDSPKVTNWNSFKDKDEEDNAKINQIVRIIHYLKCLPLKTTSMDRVEADDVIAYLSNYLVEKYNSKIFIVSSDKDFLQLVNENIVLYRPVEREFFTPLKTKEKYGLYPENFIIYKTLLGDDSDTLPGIKGLGKKTIFKKFPELADKKICLDDIFDICERKYKEHIIYSRILFDKESILNNYKLMDLSHPMMDDKEKAEIHNLVESNTPELNANVFVQLYNSDGLGVLFKDVSWWLRENFKILNSFK